MSDRREGPGTEWLDPAERGRTVEELVLRRRHEAAYEFAREYATGTRVVDLACGVGYGGGVLGRGPERYVGVDRSLEALRTAASRTEGLQGDFTCADVTGAVPLRSGCAGLVLGFQILEHIPVPRTTEFLEELGRLCEPGGHVILTTPNRRHRLLPLQRPWNPYHVREFRRAELADLLEEVWTDVSVLGLRADEEIERVELARVRQDPLAVYGRPLKRFLPERLRSWLGDLLDAGEGGEGDSPEPGPVSPEQVTTGRFRVEEDPEGRGLDLVAVCRP